MPRIEIDGELLEIADCALCGRTVLADERPVSGFIAIAPCGRQLLNISECGENPLCHIREKEN
jgi:hypothetical protein